MNLTLPTPARVISDRRLVDVALMNLQRTYDMKTKTPEEVKPLETEFTRKGWDHRQIAREGDIAIFLRSKGISKHYEVVRIRSHNGFKLPTGQMSEPAEYYPNDNAWGVDGFTLPDLPEATAKMAVLVAKACRK